MSLIDFGGHFFCKCLAVRPRTNFWSSVNICGIHLAEFVRSFKMCFKMEYTCDSDIPTFWQYHVSCIWNYFPIFWDICLSCYNLHVGQICCIFDLLCSSLNFLSPPTICLIRYIIRPINIPQFSKKNLHYRKTESCANLYRSFNFFNILDPLPNQFANSGQRLALLKWRSLRLRGAEG